MTIKSMVEAANGGSIIDVLGGYNAVTDFICYHQEHVGSDKIASIYMLDNVRSSYKDLLS